MLQESSPEAIHYILPRVLDSPDQFGLSGEQLETVLKNLREVYPRELVPVILAPLLYPEESIEHTAKKMAHEPMAKNISELSLADLIVETGYQLTNSTEECRSHLSNFGSLNAPSIARALTCMARTHGAPPWPDNEQDKNEKTWNVEVFVKVFDMIL